MTGFLAYLTIDDAPSTSTRMKMDVLKARGIHAIWFCRGEFIDRLPDVADAIIKEGHVIGNHSWNHPAFSTINFSTCKDQIDRTEGVINAAHARVGQRRPFKHFRFPWGDKGGGNHLENAMTGDQAKHVQALQALLQSMNFVQPGFHGIQYPSYPGHDFVSDRDTWFTFDALEWMLLSKKPNREVTSLDQVVCRLDDAFLAKRCNPAMQDVPEVIIMHDFDATAFTFEPIIDGLLANGARFSMPDT
jgi:peptidoglycan/xylan/chitin deacetylase (PgdA/CDA1 family)